MSAYFKINSAHAQISENAKTDLFFDKLYDLYFKSTEKSSTKDQQLNSSSHQKMP